MQKCFRISIVLLYLISGIGSTSVPSATAQVNCKLNNILYLEPDGTRVLSALDFVSECMGCTVDVVGDLYADQVDCNLAGKEVTVIINQPGQPMTFCRARLLDGTAPTFVSCPDLTIGCHLDVMSDPIDSFGIVVTDSCGLDTIFPIICGSEPGDCVNTTKILKVQWQAIDRSGNVATCIQFLSYMKENVSQVTFPAADTLYCDELVASVVNEPMIRDSVPIDAFCGLLLGAPHDDTLKLCGAERRILRSWTILDACSLVSRTGSQEIYILDTTPPEIACPTDDTLFVDPLSCLATYMFPYLDQTLVYNCSPHDSLVFSKFLYRDAAFLPGDITQLHIGSDTVFYYVADECWNMDTCHFMLTVRDTFPPEIRTCPRDTMVLNMPPLQGITDCDDLNAHFGDPATFSVQCCLLDQIFCDIVNTIDDLANTGSITRKYWAQDTCGNVSDTCIQVIAIMGTNGMVGSSSEVRSFSRRTKNGDHGFDDEGSLRQGHEVGVSSIVIWPNPFVNHMAVDYRSAEHQQVQVYLIDSQGRAIHRETRILDRGDNRLYFYDTNGDWPLGLIYLKLEIGDGHSEIRKILHMRE